MKKILITLAVFTLTASFAQEMQQPRGGNGGKPPQNGGKPPQEAITACQGKDAGATCSVETPRGDTLEGTCQNTPDKKYFVCMPNDHRPEQ